MNKTTQKRGQSPFCIIPYYTGDKMLEKILKNPKSISLLWLEILFNDKIQWENHLNQPEVKAAYEKACLWYVHFKTMVEGHTGRKPLEIRMGHDPRRARCPCEEKIDDREYRRFLEALNFVAG